MGCHDRHSACSLKHIGSSPRYGCPLFQRESSTVMGVELIPWFFLGKDYLIQSSIGGGKEKGCPIQNTFSTGHGMCHLIIEGDRLPERGVLSDQVTGLGGYFGNGFSGGRGTPVPANCVSPGPSLQNGNIAYPQRPKDQGHEYVLFLVTGFDSSFSFSSHVDPLNL